MASPATSPIATSPSRATRRRFGGVGARPAAAGRTRPGTCPSDDLRGARHRTHCPVVVSVRGAPQRDRDRRSTELRRALDRGSRQRRSAGRRDRPADAGEAVRLQGQASRSRMRSRPTGHPRPLEARLPACGTGCKIVTGGLLCGPAMRIRSGGLAWALALRGRARRDSMAAAVGPGMPRGMRATYSSPVSPAGVTRSAWLQARVRRRPVSVVSMRPCWSMRSARWPRSSATLTACEVVPLLRCSVERPFRDPLGG